ncbi:MAG: HlyD family efflux transporter periplasmic adaptor subunit [Bacteroidales bacterium]
MEERKKNIIYSEPVRDLMGTPPSALVRWGTGVIFLVIMLLIILSWCIKYPDIVRAPAVISTQNPPEVVLSKVTGRIKHLYVSENDTVKYGQILGVVESGASIDQFRVLKIFSDTFNVSQSVSLGSVPDLSDLGELQDVYGVLRKSVADRDNFLRNNIYASRIRSSRDAITQIQIKIGSYLEKQKAARDIYETELKKLGRAEKLAADSTLKANDYDIAKQSLRQKETELNQINIDIQDAKIELNRKQEEFSEYVNKQQEETELYLNSVDEAFRSLRASITKWELDYLFVSHVDGTVSLPRVWNVNQIVNSGQQVLTVLPFERGEYLGRITLTLEKSGKVRPGNFVNIKLAGYPYLEFGMLRGVISLKSPVVSDESYLVEVIFPDGLKTSYGKSIEFTQNMQGTAEIITEDLRLLQRIVAPFRHLVMSGKR